MVAMLEKEEEEERRRKKEETQCFIEEKERDCRGFRLKKDETQRFVINEKKTLKCPYKV